MAKSPSSSSSSSNAAGAGLSYQALFFMSLLSIQFGIQPIVTQKFTSKAITKSTVIFMQEVVKLVIGVVGISLGKERWGVVTAGECGVCIYYYILWCMMCMFLNIYVIVVIHCWIVWNGAGEGCAVLFHAFISYTLSLIHIHTHNTSYRMDRPVMDPSSSPPSPNLPNPKHVFPPRLSKSRCHYLQCTQSNQNTQCGTMLLFNHVKETIYSANDGIVGTIDGGVGYGESVADGYAFAFVLDEWK